MRYRLPILFILVTGLNIFGQEKREGKVTYITSQHVYVKFSSMEDITEGDTLYIQQGGKDVPALQIKNLSSISCVCLPLLTDAFKVSDKVYAKLVVEITSASIGEQVAIDPSQSDKRPESDSSRAQSPQLDVADKEKRVANFHEEMVKTVVELLAASGLDSTEKLTRSHIHRRVSATETKRYDEIFPYVTPGRLLEPPYPKRFQQEMQEASSCDFAPGVCVAYYGPKLKEVSD